MKLFKKKTPAARIASTGHQGDDQLLALLAERTDLGAPRHWVHYLYFSDQATARDVAAKVNAAGWGIQEVGPSAGDDDPSWVVIAERHDAVTGPDEVRDARIFFEAIAATHPGGDYDGWEASA